MLSFFQSSRFIDKTNFCYASNSTQLQAHHSTNGAGERQAAVNKFTSESSRSSKNRIFRKPTNILKKLFFGIA